MAVAGGLLGTIGSIASAAAPLIGAISGGGGGASQAAPPPPPQVSSAPEAPKESTAAEVTANEPVVDQEAARIRAQKRRDASRDEQDLFSLSDESKDATTLTKSLLGE